MLEGGDRPAHLGHLGEVDLGDTEADIGAGIGQHITPGADDQGVTAGPATAGVIAGLAGRELSTNYWQPGI